MFGVILSVLKSIPSIYLLVAKDPRPGDKLDMPEQACAPPPPQNAKSAPPNLTQRLDLQGKVSHAFLGVESTWVCNCRFPTPVSKVLET